MLKFFKGQILEQGRLRNFYLNSRVKNGGSHLLRYLYIIFL
jgi:hypothetical protein